MSVESRRVSTPAQLVEATQACVPEIEVQGILRGLPMITLAPGVQLRGGTLEFGAKGVRLTRDNVLEDIAIRVPEHEAAILNDTSMPGLGTLILRRVRTTGQVLLLARDAIRSGHVQVFRLTVDAADLRGRAERPQGAFTLWNLQPDPTIEITAQLFDLAAGSADRPVRGSGVFVGGAVRVRTVRTGEIHVEGGGVLVTAGASVKRMFRAGPVTTYRPNDMALQSVA
jgi:hypothetical protein